MLNKLFPWNDMGESFCNIIKYNEINDVDVVVDVLVTNLTRSSLKKLLDK